MRKLNIINCGQLDYDSAHQLQLNVLKQVQDGVLEDTLILIEHPAVITMGRHANDENVLFSEAFLNERGISLRTVERGGDATYHGPGQLVGYPIFDIKKRHNRSIKAFVNNLEQLIIDYLIEKHQLDATRHPANAGVWLGNSKICALGLAVKQGVTFHGFALNVSTDLRHYQYIVPCGLSQLGVTSIEQQLGTAPSLAEVSMALVRHFQRIYQFDQIVDISGDFA